MWCNIASLIIKGYYRLQPCIEALEETAGTVGTGVSGIYQYPEFLSRLTEETERARRYQLELGLVVFHLTPATRKKSQDRKLEVALRDCLRKADIPGRLSEHMLAVVLPETGRGTPAAAERIASVLQRVGGGLIGTGFACYPIDGLSASELLHIAIERSTRAGLPALVLCDARTAQCERPEQDDPFGERERSEVHPWRPKQAHRPECSLQRL